MTRITTVSVGRTILTVGLVLVLACTAGAVEQCGILIPGDEDCLLFLSDSLGVSFELDDYGLYGPGDYVVVDGVMDPGCTPYCSQAVGCIIVNSIALCRPSDQYDGCGVLQAFGTCWVYLPEEEQGEAWLLDDYGLFGPGTPVCVSGDLIGPCDSLCPEITGCITNTVIDSSNGGGMTYPIDACGVLVQGPDCLLFEVSAGPTGFAVVLDYYGGYQEGDSVCVRGMLTLDCTSGCAGAAGCVEVWEITPALSGGDYYENCGVLVNGSACLLFQPFGGYTGLLQLDDYGGFGLGDSVFVTGTLTPACSSSCPDANGCLVGTAISGGCSPFGMYIYAEGVLIDTSGCLLFNPFADPSQLYQLEQYMNFQAGDTVLVDGILDLECPSSCPAATGCVYLNVIVPLSDPERNTQLLIQMMPGFGIEPVIAPFGGVVVEILASPNLYLVEFPGEYFPAELAELLMLQEGVVSVQPNYTVTIPEGHQMSISFPDESMPAFVAHVSPEAFYAQPGNETTGIDSAQMIPQIASVTVAIIDNGIDADHPLLASAVLDAGYDFLDYDNDPSEGPGTFIAGLIRLANDNCSILPLRAFDSAGYSTDFAVAEAIYYAIDQGVDVINMSFGMHAPATAIASAVADAHEAGIVMVASVGNESTTEPTYPAAYAHVIAVSCLDSAEAAASFSNGGTFVDICAPGVNIYSSLTGAYDWGTWSGTSFSAPLVAGACALLLGRNPDLSPEEVKQTICSSARTELASGSYDWPDPILGNGCLDAFHAGLAWIRGDIENSGTIDISDLVDLVSYMFQGSSAPVLSIRTADVDCSGEIDISDLVVLAQYMFQNADAPWPCYDQ